MKGLDKVQQTSVARSTQLEFSLKSSSSLRESLPCRSSKAASQLVDKLCALYEFVSKLLALRPLEDNIVLQLATLAVTTFTVDNVQLLQLKAIVMLCSVSVLASLKGN